jgi:NADPH-dependent curcumin reductase CurA
MASDANRQIHLVAYPAGVPDGTHFRMVRAPRSEPREGQFVARTIYLSMDPVRSARMRPGNPFGPPVPLGQPVPGRGLAVVSASRHPGFAEGDLVSGELSWQDYPTCDGSGVSKVPPGRVPLTAHLTVFGPSGLTAYFAVRAAGRPKPGETVLVSAAAGSVGSIAGQVAKIDGARVIGLTSSPSKARFLTENLGFDDAVDYRSASNLVEALGAACPNGADVVLDSVGGRVHDAALATINDHARVVLIGLVSTYNDQAAGAEVGPRNLWRILMKRAVLSGFLIADHREQYPSAVADFGLWLAEGRLTFKVTITDGLERAPEAFAGLFRGENIGKQLVRVSDEPSLR